MKTILTYSGKGGVGKTTVTYCLYKAFKSLDKKVVVLDMDLNTPSFHLLAKGGDVISNYKDAGLFNNEAQINFFVRDAIQKIKKLKPEILLIDSPPSITSIHFTLLKKFEISGVVLVSQPTKLSKSDVMRTVPFFEQKGISVLGIIENMVGKRGLNYGYPKLCSLPMIDALDSKKVYSDNEEKITKVAKKLLKMDLKWTSIENQKRMIFDESLSWGDAKKILGVHESNDGDFYFYDKHKSLSDLHFLNLGTWEKVREVYMSMYSIGPFAQYSDCVTEASYEKVELLVKAFEYDDQVQFMITKSLDNVVPLVIGEVGTATLLVDHKFNRIPTINYKTNAGEVRLFPHEVTPVNQQILNDCAADGYFYIEEGGRYMPPLSLVEEIAGIYGQNSISSWKKATEWEIGNEQ